MEYKLEPNWRTDLVKIDGVLKNVRTCNRCDPPCKASPESLSRTNFSNKCIDDKKRKAEERKVNPLTRIKIAV